MKVYVFKKFTKQAWVIKMTFCFTQETLITDRNLYFANYYIFDTHSFVLSYNEWVNYGK